MTEVKRPLDEKMEAKVPQIEGKDVDPVEDEDTELTEEEAE